MLTRWWLRFSSNSSFAKNVIILTGATLFAQGLNVLSLPILTRLFSPDDFGQFAVYSALLGIVAVAAGLRFELAIALPDSDTDGMSLLILALFSTLGVAVGFWLVWTMLATISINGASLAQSPAAPLIWAVSLGVLLVGISAALQAWSARKNRFRLIAKSRLVQAVAGVGTSLLCGATVPSAIGLILGHLAFSGFGIVSLIKETWRLDRMAINAVSLVTLKEQARKFRAFPIYSVPEAFFNAGGWHLPVLIMSAWLLPAEMGQLLLATRLIGVPMVLVGASVAQVYVAEAPNRARDGTLHAFTLQTMRNLARVGVLPIAGLGGLSPWLFPILFGGDWARAGVIVAWLTPWYLAQFVASPVGTALHVLGKMRLSMLIQLAGMIVRVAAVGIAITIAPQWAIETYAVSGIMVYLIQFVVIDVYLMRYERAR